MSKLACLFPGQGSQSKGMLADLGEDTAVKQAFSEASGALGYNLWEMVQSDPQGELDRTDRTQPALLTASVALWRAWEQRGGRRPHVLAGHSLGEYTALVCAGVLTLGDAARLVEKRGQLMQGAVPEGEGRMAAILGLEDSQVRQACAQAAQGDVVEAVNFNAPGQVVIAGSADAVDRAIAACKAAGAKRALPIPVSVPSHCALMKPAADELANVLAGLTFHAPEIPVINNVDVCIESDPSRIRSALARQLYNPVRWVETIQKLVSDGASTALECGPGKVLSGLGKRITSELRILPLENLAALEIALKELDT